MHVALTWSVANQVSSLKIYWGGGSETPLLKSRIYRGYLEDRNGSADMIKDDKSFVSFLKEKLLLGK